MSETLGMAISLATAKARYISPNNQGFLGPNGLSDEQISRFLVLWHDGVKATAIAHEFGMHVASVAKIARRLRLPIRQVGRTKITASKHDRNRQAVLNYAVTHPWATNQECAQALGLSIRLTRRYVADARSTWKIRRARSVHEGKT